MKVLILAAGYATRLYPLTENKPKPLLEIAGKPIIEYILDKLKNVDEINEVMVVTNNRFYKHFKDWLETFNFTKKIKIINDGTSSNNDRLGSVGDLLFVLNKEKVDENLLMIAGDNLFGFDLTKFINFFNEKKTSIVAFHDLKNFEKVKEKFGVGVLDGNKVVDFQEKPLNPKSTLASTGCYLFKTNDFFRIKEVVEQGKADRVGDLINYLVLNSKINGFIFDEHWFDVGSFELLREAEEVYNKNEN